MRERWKLAFPPVALGIADWTSPTIPQSIHRPWQVFARSLEVRAGMGGRDAVGTVADAALSESLAACRRGDARLVFQGLAFPDQRRFTAVSLVQLSAFVRWSNAEIFSAVRAAVRSRSFASFDRDLRRRDLAVTWDAMNYNDKMAWMAKDPLFELADDSAWSAFLADDSVEYGRLFLEVEIVRDAVIGLKVGRTERNMNGLNCDGIGGSCEMRPLIHDSRALFFPERPDCGNDAIAPTESSHEQHPAGSQHNRDGPTLLETGGGIIRGEHAVSVCAEDDDTPRLTRASPTGNGPLGLTFPADDGQLAHDTPVVVDDNENVGVPASGSTNCDASVPCLTATTIREVPPPRHQVGGSDDHVRRGGSGESHEKDHVCLRTRPAKRKRPKRKEKRMALRVRVNFPHMRFRRRYQASIARRNAKKLSEETMAVSILPDRNAAVEEHDAQGAVKTTMSDHRPAAPEIHVVNADDCAGDDHVSPGSASCVASVPSIVATFTPEVVPAPLLSKDIVHSSILDQEPVQILHRAGNLDGVGRQRDEFGRFRREVVDHGDDVAIDLSTVGSTSCDASAPSLPSAALQEYGPAPRQSGHIKSPAIADQDVIRHRLGVDVRDAVGRDGVRFGVRGGRGNATGRGSSFGQLTKRQYSAEERMRLSARGRAAAAARWGSNRLIGRRKPFSSATPSSSDMSEGPASDDHSAIGISSDESVDPEEHVTSRSTARQSLHAGRPPSAPIANDANEGSAAAGSPRCDASAPSVPSRDPSAALLLAQRMPEQVPMPRLSSDIGFNSASQEAFQRLQGRVHATRAEERRILHQQPLALQQRKAFLEQRRAERHEADDALYHEALSWYKRALEQEDWNWAARALLRAKGKVASSKRWGHESTRWAALADRIRAEGLCAGAEGPSRLRQASVEVPKKRNLPRFTQWTQPARKATASSVKGAVQTRSRDNSTGQFLKQPQQQRYFVDSRADLRYCDNPLITGSQADQHTQREHRLARLLGKQDAQRLSQSDRAFDYCQRTEAKRRQTQARSHVEAVPPAKRLRTVSDLRTHLQQFEFSAPGREGAEDVFFGTTQSGHSEALEVSC